MPSFLLAKKMILFVFSTQSSSLSMRNHPVRKPRPVSDDVTEKAPVVSHRPLTGISEERARRKSLPSEVLQSELARFQKTSHDRHSECALLFLTHFLSNLVMVGAFLIFSVLFDRASHSTKVPPRHVPTFVSADSEGQSSNRSWNYRSFFSDERHVPTS